MKHPLKVATPETAVTVGPPPVPHVIAGPALPLFRAAMVTDAEDDVTTFPDASSTLTTGCCAKAVPAVFVVEGAVVNTNCDAAAGFTVTVGWLLMATGAPPAPEDVVKVVVPAALGVPV
jgi:hypothetical protein